MAMLETIRTLVREKDICVMATSEGDLPHTSLMTYSAEDDGQTFYFLSRMNTRKMRNLRTNPEVSLLIDTREEHLPQLRHKAMALTVAGTYHPPRDRAHLLRLKEAFTARHPHLEEFAGHGDTTIMIVKARSFLLLVGVEEQHFIDLENFSEKSA